MPLLFAPGDGNQSDREALAPLLARYRQALDLGAVVVLDGAGYSRENLRALEGFSWILRVPATLKEARALLEGEFPREAWTPLLPGYRGLEVEADYGGGAAALALGGERGPGPGGGRGGRGLPAAGGAGGGGG